MSELHHYKPQVRLPWLGASTFFFKSPWTCSGLEAFQKVRSFSLIISATDVLKSMWWTLCGFELWSVQEGPELSGTWAAIQWLFLRKKSWTQNSFQEKLSGWKEISASDLRKWVSVIKPCSCESQWEIYVHRDIALIWPVSSSIGLAFCSR